MRCKASHPRVASALDVSKTKSLSPSHTSQRFLTKSPKNQAWHRFRSTNKGSVLEKSACQTDTSTWLLLEIAYGALGECIRDGLAAWSRSARTRAHCCVLRLSD